MKFFYNKKSSILKAYKFTASSNIINIKKITEKQAVEQFLVYIKDAVLVGHHVGYDIKMLNAALERNAIPPLENKYIDTNYLFKKNKNYKYFVTERS
ncbi:3'-5' exonuclease [Capnocytophaga canimorsus]|nr:3'-5' exonuclease [Capnocytophaga canimorsus]WGU70190.1 3'-5' exonuclease [Capnocytophaga canimorsus]